MSRETKPTAPDKRSNKQSGKAADKVIGKASKPPQSASPAAPASAQGATPSVSHSSTQPAKLKSKKLDRTLAELETAFAAWDSITDDAKPAPVPELKKRADSVDSKSQDQEFRAKTKKLLSQLRDQLADLSDDKL